jgi:hypothetical protein
VLNESNCAGVSQIWGLVYKPSISAGRVPLQHIHLAVQAYFTAVLWPQSWCNKHEHFHATISAYLFRTDAKR